MLGERYFKLVQSLNDSRTFEEVAGLLTTQLPQHFDGDHATVAMVGLGPELLEVFGSSPSCEVARNHFEQVAQQIPKHPLLGSVDFANPGNLGFAASEFLNEGEYAASEFNLGLPELMQAHDSLAGRLSNCCSRSTLLFVCREAGNFEQEDHEVFDAILFTARAVLERIAGQSIEARFRKFLLSSGAGSPIAMFSLGKSKEVLPMNFLAIRLTEKWWGMDEPYRKLDDKIYDVIVKELCEAWVDPVVANFRPVPFDLGGGEMTFYALPKLDGEVFLVAPIPDSRPVNSDDAVNAVLTKRQREIMDWISEGKTSAEAAIILDISPRTVEKHLEAVFQRLGVENRIAAVRRFLDLKAGLTI